MKRANYYIKKGGRKSSKFEEVDGYIHEITADVFGKHYALTIGLHKNENGGWNATHLESGIAYTGGKNTRKEALQFVEDNLFTICDFLEGNKSLEAEIEELSRFKETHTISQTGGIFTKQYVASIYGRENSIYRAIRGRLVFQEYVSASSHKEAKQAIWDKFKHGEMLSVSPVPYNRLLKRSDVKIESDLIIGMEG